MASVIQVNMENKVPSTEPVGQICKARERRGTVLFTDCDAGSGASGAVLLTRKGDRLVAVGTHVASDPDSDNYTPYNRKSTYSLALGFGPIVLADIKAVADGEASASQK